MAELVAEKIDAASFVLWFFQTVAGAAEAARRDTLFLVQRNRFLSRTGIICRRGNTICLNGSLLKKPCELTKKSQPETVPASPAVLRFSIRWIDGNQSADKSVGHAAVKKSVKMPEGMSCVSKWGVVATGPKPPPHVPSDLVKHPFH